MKTKMKKEDKGKEQKDEKKKKKAQRWVGREMRVERVGMERAGKRKLI